MPDAPLHAAAARPTIKPRHLSPGDTVGIVSPASATFETVDLQIAQESLEALGLKVKLGPAHAGAARLSGGR